MLSAITSTLDAGELWDDERVWPVWSAAVDALFPYDYPEAQVRFPELENEVRHIRTLLQDVLARQPPRGGAEPLSNSEAPCHPAVSIPQTQLSEWRRMLALGKEYLQCRVTALQLCDEFQGFLCRAELDEDTQAYLWGFMAEATESYSLPYTARYPFYGTDVQGLVHVLDQALHGRDNE